VLLEAQGSLGAAAAAIRSATQVEPSDWRAWLIKSRIEAERGNATASLDAYRRAKGLNPRSNLFK
jgi:cytochrome c-type biogenesis protein CcmH/NrfG